MSVTQEPQIQYKSQEHDTYELIARASWQNMDHDTPFHKNAINARGSKLFNKEFREIYWKIGHEEFPEKILMLQEIRDAQYGFSNKTKSFMKSKLLNRIKNPHYP
jgi:hypothetical protein